MLHNHQPWGKNTVHSDTGNKLQQHRTLIFCVGNILCLGFLDDVFIHNFTLIHYTIASRVTAALPNASITDLMLTWRLTYETKAIKIRAVLLCSLLSSFFGTNRTKGQKLRKIHPAITANFRVMPPNGTREGMYIKIKSDVWGAVQAESADNAARSQKMYLFRRIMWSDQAAPAWRFISESRFILVLLAT